MLGNNPRMPKYAIWVICILDMALLVEVIIGLFRINAIRHWDNIDIEFHSIMSTPLLVSGLVLAVYHLSASGWTSCKGTEGIYSIIRLILARVLLIAVIYAAMVATQYNYSVITR